ncbi:MAG: hypothetical protein GC185_08550 [Alphaproteobacteria bacterium]|nr:hypothetical protein [Alphaproteobacteria bacterium]
MQAAKEAPQTQKKDGPMVLVYIGEDDPSRGDSHGLKGIGQRMAQKLNGKFHYLEDDDLKRMYLENAHDVTAPGAQDAPAPVPEPGKKSVDMDKLLKRYLKENGKPEIVLSRFGQYNDAIKSAKPLLIVRDINETLSSRLLGEKSLVSHHLTPELLKAEGEKFRAQHPDFQGPLIGVLMVDINGYSSFAEKMVSKCAAYPQATIFLCGSRRTPNYDYDNLKEELEKAAKKKGLEGRLRIDGYNFLRGLKNKDAFNPYVGLLDAADHIVLTGNSQSMLSEPLAAGKPVILHGSFNQYKKLKRKGLVMDFGKCAADKRFETGRIKPVNITEDITDKLIKDFKNAQSTRRGGPVGWALRATQGVKNFFLGF